MHQSVRHSPRLVCVVAAACCIVACAPTEVEWIPASEVARAEVHLAYRNAYTVDFPELVLAVLSDMDGWAVSDDRSEEADCTVSFEPTNFSYADVVWVGPDWVGTSFRERSWYRALSPSEGDLLREALGLRPGQCGIPLPSVDSAGVDAPGESTP